MQIFRTLSPYSAATAVALGYFDGVHLGHRAVLSEAVRYKSEGLVPTAFTFSSTPKSEDARLQLSTYDEKIELLEKIGIEVLYILDFELLRDKSPEQFVSEIISGVFNAKKVFCGFNYRFGKRGSGSTEDLTRLCAQRGITAGVCAPVEKDGVVVSSTEIRRLLQRGDVERANALLGYDFGLRSKVVEGNHIGAAMDTPTINLTFEKDIILPKFGVYASVVTIDGQRHAGVTNVGIKPTIANSNAPNCETWLPLYDGGALYGKTVDVRLKKFIRPEQKFSGLDELQAAIKRDGKTAVEITKNTL